MTWRGSWPARRSGPRPPSTLDRCVKFARRHRALVVGVTAVMAVLALGIAATSVMALRESRARRLADQNAARALASADQAEAARTAALREAYQARLAAAMAAMGTHDIREAGRQLEAAPAELRGWEWRHLHGRLDQSLAVVAGPPGTTSIAFCPPGRRLAVADGRSEYRLLDAVTGECLAVRGTDSALPPGVRLHDDAQGRGSSSTNRRKPVPLPHRRERRRARPDHAASRLGSVTALALCDGDEPGRPAARPADSPIQPAPTGRGLRYIHRALDRELRRNLGQPPGARFQPGWDADRRGPHEDSEVYIFDAHRESPR